ncbi:MAG TPA: response regulator transcription factor [Spirochaetia bacterium]|nr:response regulator transcription factor [Spirochaetia bacterium]
MIGTPERQDNETHRLFVVDDHPIVREGLIRVLKSFDDLTVIGGATSPVEALASELIAEADIIVTDIVLQNSLQGLKFITRLRHEYPRASVLVFTAAPTATFARRALRAGAKGYLEKTASPELVRTAVRTLASGKTYMGEELASLLVGDLVEGHRAEVTERMDQLTIREVEVLTQLGEGRSPKEIARRLDIGAKTVNTYCHRLKRKLRLGDKNDLLKAAIQWRHIDFPMMSSPA